MKQEEQIKRAKFAYLQRLNSKSQAKNRYLIFLQIGSEKLDKLWPVFWGKFTRNTILLGGIKNAKVGNNF